MELTNKMSIIQQMWNLTNIQSMNSIYKQPFAFAFLLIFYVKAYGIAPGVWIYLVS